LFRKCCNERVAKNGDTFAERRLQAWRIKAISMLMVVGTWSAVGENLFFY
jgi:hypothetical protein